MVHLLWHYPSCQSLYSWNPEFSNQISPICGPVEIVTDGPLQQILTITQCKILNPIINILISWLSTGNFAFEKDSKIFSKIGTVFDLRDYTSLLFTNFSGSFFFLTIGDAINNSTLRYFYVTFMKQFKLNNSKYRRSPLLVVH